MSRRFALWASTAYLGFLAVLVAVAYALSNAEVVAEGHLVDSVDHDVARVRVLDRFTAYADESLVPFGSDLITSFALMTLAGMALLAFTVVVRSRPDDRRFHLFFLVLATGATFLAFDEQYELIDSLGYNVEALYLPDAVFYGPAGLVFAWFFREYLVVSRKALAALVVGAGLFAVAQGFDRLPHDRFEGVEEKAEAVASVLLAIGFAMAAVHLLAPTSYRQEPEPESVNVAPATGTKVQS